MHADRFDLPQGICMHAHLRSVCYYLGHEACHLAVCTLLAGGWFMGYANIVTAVIGSGVLSLAWSMSWLGEHPIAQVFCSSGMSRHCAQAVFMACAHVPSFLVASGTCFPQDQGCVPHMAELMPVCRLAWWRCLYLCIRLGHTVSALPIPLQDHCWRY